MDGKFEGMVTYFVVEDSEHESTRTIKTRDHQTKLSVLTTYPGSLLHKAE